MKGGFGMVHISQFYPCSKVTVAGELYYICELGKYLQTEYGIGLSIDGVLLKADLRKSPIWEYFRLAVSRGWLENVGDLGKNFSVSSVNPLSIDSKRIANYYMCLDPVTLSIEEIRKRQTDFEYAVSEPQKFQISFETMEDDYWLWSIGGKDNRFFNINNQALNRNRADQAWLSLIAMVAVKRHFTGVPQKLLLRITSQAVLQESSMAYVLMLSDKTLALHGWCELYFDKGTISSSKRLHLDYVSWYTEGIDIGMCDRFYTGEEKYQYATKKLDIQVGDLVMLYTRDKAQARNYMKNITSCHLSKVLAFSPSEIKLQLINTTYPRYQGYLNFEAHPVAVKNMYREDKPYDRILISDRSMNMIDLGVEYMLYTELMFITPLEASSDVRVCCVTDGVREDKLCLTQNELIYWILKDYDYDFNESRFLARYFKDKLPLRTRYLNGEELEDYVYYREVKE